LQVLSLDACDSSPCEAEDGVFHVTNDLRLRIVADGPNDDSESLLADAGITPNNFFMLDADDAIVATTLSGNAGGHVCRNGVNFGLEPDEDLAPGAYTVVLITSDLAWPLLGSPSLQTYEGKAAFVRKLHVAVTDTTNAELDTDR